MSNFVLPKALAEALRAVRSAGVITGAGISAESGVPTYRGKGGVYDDPEEGGRTIEALTGSSFAQDPDRSWLHISRIARASGGAKPNTGHLALVEMERKLTRFVLLTQNVDGLHRRAGSRNLIEIHGNTFETVCTACGREGTLAPPDLPDHAPRCESCGGVVRPDVVLFGEMLDPGKIEALYRQFVFDMPDMVVSVGTSALFPYIVEPVATAARAGKLTIEVNPERTELSDFVDFHLAVPAGTALPVLVQGLPTG